MGVFPTGVTYDGCVELDSSCLIVSTAGYVHNCITVSSPWLKQTKTTTNNKKKHGKHDLTLKKTTLEPGL